MNKYTVCRTHENCRSLPASGALLEIVGCPWCGYPVSTSNIGKWCAECYTLFEIIGNRVHFSKSFKPTFAQALAISIAKSGGVSFGPSELDGQHKD